MPQRCNMPRLAVEILLVVGRETEDAIVAGVIVTIAIITFVVAGKADRILSRRLMLFEELNTQDKIKELELKSSISQNNDV